MAIPFNPPDWVIQEYMKRRSPWEEASAGIQTGLQNYIALDQSKRRNALAEQELANSNRDRFYKYGDPSGLGPQEQSAINDPVQGPVTEQGQGPQLSPVLQYFKNFSQALPQGTEGTRTPEQIKTTQPQTYYDPETGQEKFTLPAGGKLAPQPPSMQFVGTQSGQPVFANPKTMQMKTGSLPGQGPLMSTTQTEGQANATLYASRMEEADKQLASIYQGTNMSSARSGVERLAPNIAKSDPIQMAEQAERNFLNSVLRRESGAVISPSEFKEGKKQYFEVFGDSEAVKKQKRINRQTALDGLRNAAGMAPGSAPQSQWEPSKEQRYQAWKAKQGNP